AAACTQLRTCAATSSTVKEVAGKSSSGDCEAGTGDNEVSFSLLITAALRSSDRRSSPSVSEGPEDAEGGGSVTKREPKWDEPSAADDKPDHETAVNRSVGEDRCRPGSCGTMRGTDTGRCWRQ